VLKNENWILSINIWGEVMMGIASYNLSKIIQTPGIYKHVLFKKLRKTGAK
jgi:hypothetical protein